MNQKKWIQFLTIEAVLCIFVAVLNGANNFAFTPILSFPFEQIGLGLRALSLSGGIQNVLAIILYASLCLSPMIYLAIRVYQKKNKIEDTVLALLSLLLFLVLYWMINPAYINDLFAMPGSTRTGKIMLSISLYSVIIGYMVLRLLRAFSQSEVPQLLRFLRVLIGIMSALLVFSIFGIGVNELVTNIKTVRAGNTQASSLGITNSILFVRYILSVVPNVITIVVAFFVNHLIEALEKDRYSFDVVERANNLGHICKKAVVTMTLCSIFTNMIQLLCAKVLLQSHFNEEIPLLSILGVLFVLLLSKYFAESNAIKKDNDMFI